VNLQTGVSADRDLTMKSTSVKRGLRTRTLHYALLGLVSTFALGACGNDGPTYGEIPRDAGRAGAAAGKGGMAPANGGNDGGGEEAGGAGGAGGDEGAAGSRAGSSAHAGKGGTGGSSANGGASGSGGSSANGGASGNGGSSSSKCGNNVIDEGETCDDGNKLSGDGCSSKCQCACEACESSTGCYTRPPQVAPDGSSYYDAGYGMPGLTTEGPAPNVPRKELFRDLLDCVRETSCLALEPLQGRVFLVKCACQNPPAAGEPLNGWPAACFNDATLMKGPCLRQMLEAAEADTLISLKERAGTEDYAVGMVQSILNICDTSECRSECFKPEQSSTWPATIYDAPVRCDNCKAEDACMP
jgi:cysteine-rich repeat protein